MNEDSAGSRRQGGPRQATVAATLAGIALLAAACSGSSHPAGSAATPSQDVTQQLDAFAQCMHSHGESNFYLTNPDTTPNPSATQLVG